MEVLQREFPAAEWKSYKSWYDKSLGEGENYITLIGTGGSNAASASSTITPPPAGIASLLRDFSEQLMRGELNAAEQTLAQIKTADANSIWYYRGIVAVQGLKGKPDEAAEASRKVMKSDGVTDQDKKAAAAIFYTIGSYSEALPLLEAQSAADPENETLKLELGTAQMKTGATGLGGKTLVGLLEKTSEDNTLNSAAYELAEGSVELDKAEKAARTVVDTLTTESTSWVVGGAATKGQSPRQSLLVATWDTLGWVLYREGRLAEAENYIRATWNNQQTPEVGLHLGEIEEKIGNPTDAMKIYQIALATIPPSSLGKVAPSITEQKQKLEERIATLKKQGTAAQGATPNLALQKMRTIKLGAWKGKNSLIEYAFTIEKDKPGDLQESDPGAVPIVGANAMIRRATFNHWIPIGSPAKLVHKGTLNCHTGVCELVIHPM